MTSPMKRLLVANRGEIAARILTTARELGIETYAVYTENDIGHIYNAAHAIRLSSPSSYMDVSELVQIVQTYLIDAVHPGYGFLSESAELGRRMAEVGVLVVGPGIENLERTGDKLQARHLAVDCNVPVLPALKEGTGNVGTVRTFAEKIGVPIMVKAVDGGGGRGIRLVRDMNDLESLVTRAIEESPSRQVFAEKAAINGYRHIEVQIIGDGQGNIMHLWERECSIQRRYQKIIELAPSTVSNREAVAPVIEAAIKMATKIRYRSLGTFEFLLHPQSREFYFLEINPRLQVEHTITECICSVDIVKAQLKIAQGASFSDAGLDDASQNPLTPPKQHSIQLRITAEDPEKHYSLSVGKIQSFRFPSGNGIRTDTALVQGVPAIVSSDFDSVIAKLIVTSRTWQDVVCKARRALEDTTISGITTNLRLLQAVLAHRDFEAKMCDTQWLEAKHDELAIHSRASEARADPFHGFGTAQTSSSTTVSVSSSSSMFRKDDAWAVLLMPKAENSSSQPRPHHLKLIKVLRNDFPSSLAADIEFTAPGSKPQAYRMDLASTRASASSLGSERRQGSRSDRTHVIVPFSGKLVEVLVDVGDRVKKNDVVCVVRQMKMELEVRSHLTGLCTWVTDAEDDEDIAEGMLGAIIEDEKLEAKL